MSEYTFQANFKLGKGYDAHLINIVGHDQHEFDSNLKWATENAAGIVSAAVALEAAYGVKPLAENVTSINVNSERPVAQGQERAQVTQTGAPGPSCGHGAMKYVAAGISKAGRPYKAFWSCTGPRDSQCKTQDA